MLNYVLEKMQDHLFERTLNISFIENNFLYKKYCTELEISSLNRSIKPFIYFSVLKSLK